MQKTLKKIEDKLYFIPFKPNTESHIKTNPAICASCAWKECTKFCPANVFHLSGVDNKLYVNYENCLECGACTIGCPYQSIEYKHPAKGFGRI